MENSQFLKGKYNGLHTSDEVLSAKTRVKKQMGIALSDNPNELIQNYLDRLSSIFDRTDNDARQQGIDALKKVIHKHFVINENDISHRVFELEQDIAEQQGHGRPEITEQFKIAKTNEIITGQINSLDQRIDYLTSTDAMYPDRAKYWVFRSILELSGYDKQRGEFSRRKKDTVKPYPILHIGALARSIELVQKQQSIIKTYDHDKKLKNIKLSEFYDRLDPELSTVLQSENFNKIYSKLLKGFDGAKIENLENINGVWRTYKQGETAKKLYDSLQGFPLEWCTATNISTAQSQLDGGDFHVYYSYDIEGKARIPRLAIRMQGSYRKPRYNEDEHDEFEGDEFEQDYENPDVEIEDPVESTYHIFDTLSEDQIKKLGIENKKVEELQTHSNLKIRKHSKDALHMNKNQLMIDSHQNIAEIRGIGEKQNIDNHISPVLEDVLNEFGEKGKDYLRKSTDMKQMTEIVDKDKKGIQLNKSELEFLYEINGEITGFGYDKDPRIEILIKDRNLRNDISVITGLTDDKEIQIYIEDKLGLKIISDHLKDFNSLSNKIIDYIINIGKKESLIQVLDKIDYSTSNYIAKKMMDLSYYSFTDEIKMYRGLSNEIAINLIKHGYGIDVIDNLDSFSGLDHNEVAEKIIEKLAGGYLKEDLDKLTGVDYNKIASKLIDKGKGNNIGLCLRKMRGVNIEIANKLIKLGYGWNVLGNLSIFPELNYNEIANNLIDSQPKGHYSGASELAMCLHKFEGLHFEIADKLIQRGYHREIIDNLKSFTKRDHNKIISRLIEKGYGLGVASDLEKFIGADHNEIVNKLIEKGDGRYVAEYLEKFKGLNNKVIEKLKEKGYSVQDYQVI